MALIVKALCECENHRHFGSGDGHTYGSHEALAVSTVFTPYGKFRICEECTECWRDTPYTIEHRVVEGGKEN